MDILIKNMEMPKEGHYYLEVFCDGEIRRLDNISEGFRDTEAKAVALPSHGKLIDADRLADEYMRYLMVCFPTMQMSTANELVSAVKEAIKIAPTIVEATE